MKICRMKKSIWLLIACVAVSPGMFASAVVSPEAFENPPNEYRITQYQLTPNTLKT